MTARKWPPEPLPAGAWFQGKYPGMADDFNRLLRERNELLAQYKIDRDLIKRHGLSGRSADMVLARAEAPND